MIPNMSWSHALALVCALYIVIGLVYGYFYGGRQS